MDIRQLCEAKGLTISKLARLVGKSENLLYKIASGTRKITPELEAALSKIEAEGNVQLSTAVHKPVERYCTHPVNAASDDLCPDCGLPLDTYQPRDVIRTVHDNNHKLKTITEELGVVMQSMRTLAQLDAMVQQRVDNVVSQHSRGIIAVYNHHITAQAALMINTLKNTIVVMREGQISDACVIRILETLIDQLKNLKGYEPPPMA